MAAKGDDRLTAQQDKFVIGLLSGMTQREAYRAAYPRAVNAKDKTIDEMACRLFNQPKVQARYELLRGVAQLDAEAAGIVSAQQVLQELANIAFANAADFVHIQVRDDGELGEIRYVPTDKLSAEKRAAIAEISPAQFGVKVKTYDKVKALELLGKNMKLFSDKLDVEASGGGEYRIEVVRADVKPKDE